MLANSQFSYLPYDDYAQSANTLFHFMTKPEYLDSILERYHLALALLRRVGRLRGDGCRGRFHEAADFLRRTSLHIVGDMGVGVQGESRAVVAQHVGQSFYIHAAGDGHRGECVPLRYNYDKPEKPRITRVFGYLARFFILFQAEKSSREVVIS